MKGWKGGDGCSAVGGEVIVIGAGNGAGDSDHSGEDCGGREVAVYEKPIGVEGVAGTCRG